MNRFVPTKAIIACIAAGALAVLAGCAQKPPPAPPPPVVVQIPPRPAPPMGAPANLTTPPLGPDGGRLTINTNLATAEAVWNLRSAYNVAALNCQGPEHGPILIGYTAFLKDHAKTLKAVYSDLDKKFRAQHGSKYIVAREAYQTQVYNYFALPPVVPSFCNAALSLTQDLQSLPKGQLEAFAPAELAKIDLVFREFFNSYDQYRADLATWEARYGGGPPLSISAAAAGGAGQ